MRQPFLRNFSRQEYSRPTRVITRGSFAARRLPSAWSPARKRVREGSPRPAARHVSPAALLRTAAILWRLNTRSTWARDAGRLGVSATAARSPDWRRSYTRRDASPGLGGLDLAQRIRRHRSMPRGFTRPAYARKISPRRGAAAPIRVSIAAECYRGGAGDGGEERRRDPVFLLRNYRDAAVATESLIGSCFLSRRHAGKFVRRKTRLDKDLLRPTCIIKKKKLSRRRVASALTNDPRRQPRCVCGTIERRTLTLATSNSRAYLPPRNMHLSTAALCLSRFSGLPLGAVRCRKNPERCVRSPFSFPASSVFSYFQRLIIPLVSRDAIRLPLVACRRNRRIDIKESFDRKAGIYLVRLLFVYSGTREIACLHNDKARLAAIR